MIVLRVGGYGGVGGNGGGDANVYNDEIWI